MKNEMIKSPFSISDVSSTMFIMLYAGEKEIDSTFDELKDGCTLETGNKDSKKQYKCLSAPESNFITGSYNFIFTNF
jgi:hypothetical protein